MAGLLTDKVDFAGQLWSHIEAATIGFTGALIGAVFDFIRSILSTFWKSKDVQLDVRTKAVTNERA